MQKSLNNQLGKQNDGIAVDIASIFNVDSSYVRKIMADDGTKYKSPKAEAIRKAYTKMKNGKNKLLLAVEKLVPISKAS